MYNHRNMDMMQIKRFVVPSIVISHFHINPGDTVADLGAGNGYFLDALAGAVGKSGTVYMCDIQKPLVESLGDQARAYPDGLIHPIWGDIELPHGTKIPTDSVDRAVLVNTLFQIVDKNAAVSEIQRLLRPGGKLFIIDWTEPWGGLGPREDMVYKKDAAVALFENSGFVFEADFPAGDHHYGIALRLP